jgi:hypothetical protein
MKIKSKVRAGLLPTPVLTPGTGGGGGRSRCC